MKSKLGGKSLGMRGKVAHRVQGAVPRGDEADLMLHRLSVHPFVAVVSSYLAHQPATTNNNNNGQQPGLGFSSKLVCRWMWKLDFG